MLLWWLSPYSGRRDASSRRTSEGSSGQIAGAEILDIRHPGAKGLAEMDNDYWMEMLPVERTSYPTLQSKELVCFLGLLKQFFVSHTGSFTEWKRLARMFSQELVGSKWAFTEIVRKLSSQHTSAPAPVLNQLAQVVRCETQSGQATDAGPRRTVYEDFMLNPAKYSPDEFGTLTTLCKTRLSLASTRKLREVNDDKWKVIIGVDAGDIACRQMLNFLRAVMASKERLHLYTTILAQVEGQVVLHIGSGREIPVIRRKMHAITDMILESAETTVTKMSVVRGRLTRRLKRQSFPK
uniref:Uncharacterized protein n=1 Tax=Hyaloperonospora arabidopsidis (strain Emoy2) TaxID=559515 RepID=M4BAV4_HYAAE